MIILLNRHVDNISKINTDEVTSLAKIFKNILYGVKDLNLAYNFYFHEVLGERNQHFYFKIKPRSSIWAGLELGTGLVINPIPPEEAVKYYCRYFVT